MSPRPSHLNLKFAAQRSIDFVAEAFDGGEDFVGGLGPSVRLGIGVVGLDEGGDVGLQLADRGVDAALQLLARQLGEPALDLIDP